MKNNLGGLVYDNFIKLKMLEFFKNKYCVCLFIIFMLSFQNVNAHALDLELSPQGYGLVRFGNTLKHTENLLKETAVIDDPSESCTHVLFSKYKNVVFMIEDGVITRADVEESIKNTSGIKVGMSVDKAKLLHPHIKILPHHYDSFGHYLILYDSNKKFSFVFEAHKSKITYIRAGLQSAASYVEGCL